MESRNLQLRRLEIAKKILADVLASKERARAKPTDLSSTAPTKTSSEVEEEQQHQIQKERRRLEWNSALKDPIREASMFYIKSERELIEETKLDELTRKLYSLQSLPVRSSNMNYVIKTMMEGLRSAFFGCRYFIALLTKSDCTELDFLEWGTDKILQVSKPSPCFDCILQNTIVTVMIDQDSSSVCSLFVPIYSITGCLGVIEIRGLYPATTTEVSSSATLQRPLNNLKSAMQKGDFRSFPRKILWRSPVERAKEENLSSSNGIFLYSMVRGRVTEVHHEHAGIAFYGGPRFTVTWEDGTKEYLVNKYQFMDVFVNTPLSLGARTTATAALSANLIKIGNLGASLLHRRNCQDKLHVLRSKLMEGNLKYKDIAIRCLESLTALMKSAVSASIVGFTDNEVTPRRLVHLNGEAHSIKKDQKKSNDTNSKASSFSEANFFIVRDIDGAEVHLYRRLDVGDSFPWAAKTAGYKRLYVHILLAENPSALALSHQTSLLNEICCIASETLLAALAAEGRKARRRELLKEAEASIRLLLSTSATEIYQQCLKYALEVLPGANVYIGLLHKDRDTVHFNYASPGSNMLGRTLSRGEGASFIALDTLETIVIQKRLLTLLEAGVEVYVTVGIVEWDAVITRVRGHLYFDVLYSDKTIETAVHGSRIQAKTKGDGMKVFGDFGYPFVCIPLRHKDKGLGVLNIDTFTEVPKSDHESHPESGLIAYLKNIGRIFGSALDSYSKERSLAHLKAVGCNVNVTYTHVLDAFVEGILANVLSMTGAVAVKVFNSSKGEQRVHEEIGRWGNPDTKSLDCALDGSSERRGRKSVQLDGITPTFQFVLNSTNKKVEHRTFVVAFSQMICKESSRCDVDALFMESIHREALAALIIIEPRRIKKAIRESNLSLIREINLHWELHTVQSLLTEVSRLIRTCFRNANLYFARMGPKEKSLRFIYGSTDLRSRLRTISFDSVEGISYFKAVSRLECFLLNHPSESFKIDAYSFPLLIIPLVVRFDTCIGVLCVDSFAEAYQEVEVSSEEVQYLETIAAYVSVALDHLYIADACRSIEEVAGQPLTLDEGTMRLNHILKNQMPDIESVDWHQVPPRPAYSDATAIFQANIVVFFSVVSLEMGILSGLSTVFVQVTCNAQKIFDSTEDDFTKGFSAKVALNAGLRFNATAFSLRLVSIEGGEPTDRVVLNIALHQLLEMPNLPLNYVLSDATLSSRPLARLCCRFHVLDTDERVGFRIDKAVLFETQLLGRVASRPFFTLHYRGKLISRVSLTASSVGSVAADCFIFIPTIEGEEEILINLSGLPYNIPVMPISKEMLGAGINAGAVVLEHQMNGSDKVSLKLTLSVVYANEFSATDYSKAIYREPESPNMRSIVPEADSISFPTACSLEIQELRYLDDVLLPDEVPALSVRCLFMGQVVGQTSVICESMHPVWYKELFSLRWNAKDDIGNCILELVLLQEREGVDVAVGILTITGEELRQLLFCKFDQQIWCKLTAIPALNLLGNYRAELLLSIKAMTVENNIMEPSDLEPMLRLDVLSATGISLKKISGRSTVPPNSSVFIRFAFNGKLIYETSPVNADTPEFTWTEESMHFRPSLLRRLEQSELEIGVWLAQNRLRTQIASHVVRGLDLCLLFGQSNLRSMWIPLELHFIPNIFARVRRAFYSMIGASSEGHSSLMVGNLQLCGGMEDPSSSAELETIEEDGRTFFLDIIAASSVYDKLRKESLPGVDATVAGVYCAVYWNDRLIGKTAVIQGSRDPCWEGQRFILRPVIGSTSLLFSRLVIELWSVRADTEHELLGSLHFKGEALNSYLTETSATCQWWPVRDVVESSLTSNRLMNAHLLLRARLREPGATPMNLKEESIFQMHVLSAKKLPRAEVFAKVNPFARVSYNGQEIARSRTLEATQSPNFDLVFNLTFNVEQVTEIGVFTVEIFTVSELGGEDILSAVDVEMEFFRHCLRSSSSVELPMATKTTKLVGVVRDPTSEIVDLKLTRIRVPPFHDPIYSTSDLWDLSTPSRNSLDLRISVVASKDLRKVFAVGHQRDAIFVVHWGGRKLGSATLIVDTSLPDASFSFRIPNYHPESLRTARDFADFEFENASLLLSLDVFHMNRFTAPSYLGSVELTFVDVHSLISGGLPAQKWINLQQSPRLPKAFVEGKIKIKIASTGSQEEIISVPSRTLLLQLVQAADLHCESSFDSVNAFVKVYWDNSFVGESLTISRSQSPTWNQLFRLQMPDASDVASQCSLYIELWSRNRITQNVFLGAVEITYKDFLWASECEGSSLAWFALKSSSRRPLPHTSKKSATQGKVELGFFPGTYSELSIEKSLLSVRRIRNDDAEASISINRVYPDVSELRTVTSEYNRLRDQDVGKGALELSISSFYPCFAQRAVFRITQKLRLIVQSRDSDEDGRWVEEPILIDIATLEESPIMISLVGLNQSGAELVLGILHVTSDILLLHAPFEANFLMLKSTNLTADVTIRMSARFRFDYWSCLGSRPVQGSLIKRRIQLISCKDLAIVNGAVPRVVCLAVQGERIIHTSPAQESCHPFWTGCSFDAEVDESSGQTVSIQVMHLDADLESRICIGTCEVPFRSFIRLSELPIDLVLAPLSSSKDSDFLVSGTVRILITVAVQGHTTTEPYFSRSKQKVTPKSLETNDFSVSKLLAMGDIIVSAVDSRRLFIALDVSAKGSLHAFSILRKRPYRFKPCSPFNKIKAAIKACIFKLEGREKSAHLRAANLHSFRDLLTTNSICSQEDSQWILAQLLLRSFPLCTCFIASMSPDRSTVHYTRYQDGKSSFFSLKYRFISGSVPTFTFPTSSCLAYEKYSDLQKTLFVTFGPFEKSIFPCIAVPFSANDGDAGFFGMDQLGFYSGGSDTNLADVEIIKQWFLDVGNCFYRASLTRIEAEINERILSYLSRHNASYEGLFRKIAEQSLVFLPHCKLIEVWSLNSTNDLRSLVFAKPEPDVVAPGVEVIIKNLHIANVHGPQGVEHLMDSLQLVVYFEYRGTSQCHCISGRQRKDWTLNRETLIILDEADLRVNLRVSEVSEDLSVLQEYSGFLDFQMSAPEFIFCTLKDLTTGIVTHSVKASLLWPRPVELQGVLVNLNSIRSFTLTIHRASSLLSQHRVLNPFCEVYWESKLIYRTVVRENTRNPVWEQHFELPYSTGSSSIVIDVYHMTFIKRDTFLGRIEIPFTDCCFHSTFARQVSLEQTAALHPSCQKFVGGSLTYSTVVNKFGPRNGHEVEIAMSGNDHSNLLSVTVDSCAGLMKADLIGERRPFIIGYLGDIKHAVLQTSNKSGSDPEWNETFQISLSSFQQKAFEHWPILTLEAWDYNQLVPNVFLGSVELSPAIYLSKKTDTFALKPSKKASHNGHVQGTMKLTFAPGSGLSSLTRHVSIRGIKSLFKVQIIRGSIERHPKIISKHFNPFVTLKLNGVIIGSTISSSSLHPKWDNQSFILDLFSVPLHLSLHLNMELNSKNMQSGKTDSLGEYRIGLMELLQPEVHEVEASFYSILSGPEDPISCTLTYKIKRVFEIESMSVEPVRYDANRIMSSGRQLATDCLTIEAISDIDSVRRKRRLSMFIENPFQRLSHIPEDIYKRITSASLNGDELQLKVGSADVIVMPSAVAPDVGRINLACRFPAGKLSREKKEFLYRMNGTLLERLNVVRERGLRWKAFVDLPEGIKHLSLPIVSSIEEVIPRYLKKIRDVTGCSCEAYLLDTVNGATVFSKVSVEPSKNLTEEILGQLSALCKQGILFQFYNDAAHIHCFSWSCLSQINLRGLQSAASELDATLGANFVNLLLTSVRQQLNDGCFVVPLIAHEEVFLGLLMLRQTNSVPAVLYDPGIEFDPLDRAMSLFSAPEEGLISALCDTAPLIASFLFSKRTDGAVHHIRGFSLDADHTYADVVKFAFKEISIAVPAIREVSLWRSFSRPRSVIGNMLASYLDQCIVVGCFEAANMAKMATVSAGDIASLYQKSKWTMKFPFTITLPEQLVKQAVFRSVLEDMRANVALMSSDTLGINMCEIKSHRKRHGLASDCLRLHSGEVLVGLEHAVGAYHRLFDINNKISSLPAVPFEVPGMKYSCQRSVVKPVKTKTMLTIPAVVGPPHADLHVDRPKYVIGTSQVTKNFHWEWENISSVLATAETCIDTPAVDEDVIDGIEPATINQHDQDASSLLDSFDLFYIAAAAKGFKDRDNGYGVIGDHVSAFLQRCAAAMEDLLIRVQGMEN